MTAKFTSLEQKQYAAAGAVAEEVLASIRTVFAFGGEKKALEQYDAKLKSAIKFSTQKGFISGSLLGIMFFFLFAAYSVAFW